MNSIMMILSSAYSPTISTVTNHLLPCTLPHCSVSPSQDLFVGSVSLSYRRSHQPTFTTAVSSSTSANAGAANSALHRDGSLLVGDFMTKREDLHVVRPTTSVYEALETLVEKRITGFPVIDDDWNLVGVVSDYDLLALDSISGCGGGHPETSLFPDVDSSWKTFNEIQKLLGKTNGKVVGDLMTCTPLVVRENTNLEDAIRLLLETKFRRLPVVDADGKLVGIITRGNVVRGALKIKRACEKT